MPLDYAAVSSYFEHRGGEAERHYLDALRRLQLMTQTSELERKAIEAYLKEREHHRQHKIARDRQLISDMTYLLAEMEIRAGGRHMVADTLDQAKAFYARHKGQLPDELTGRKSAGTRVWNLARAVLPFSAGTGPNALLLATKLLTQATGRAEIGKIGAGLADVHAVTSTAIGALANVGTPMAPHTTQIAASAGVVVGASTTAAQVAASAAPFLPLLQLAGHGTMLFSLLDNYRKITALFSLIGRYEITCSCQTELVPEIIGRLEDKIVTSAKRMHGFYALYDLAGLLLKKANRHVDKMLGAAERNPNLRITETLLAAASGSHPHQANVFFSDIHTNHHVCPIALLTLAILCGNGNAREGALKATLAAAAGSNDSTAHSLRALIG